MSVTGGKGEVVVKTIEGIVGEGGSAVEQYIATLKESKRKKKRNPR